MEIYVKSCGISIDYNWLKKPESPESLDLHSVTQKLDPDDFSIVIHRSGDRLSLLVTGLKSATRKDLGNRTIRNSVLWVGDESEESRLEARLRAIAIQALKGDLAAKVDRAVSSANNEQGFIVDFKKLDPNELVTKPPSANNETNTTSKIGNLSQCKNELVEELEQYLLPTKDGLLVVVSSTVSRSTLKEEQVWRGLSDTLNEEHLTGIEGTDAEARQKEKNSGFFPRPTPQPNTGNHKTFQPIIKLNLVIAFFFGLVLGIVGNQLWYHFQEKSLQENLNSLKVEITQKQEERNRISEQIKLSEREIEAYQEFQKQSDKYYQDLQEQADRFYNSFQNDLEKSYRDYQNQSSQSQKTLDSKLYQLQQESNKLQAKALTANQQ